MKLYAPWEKKFEKIATPFEHFLHSQTTSGLVLMAMTLIALVVANSPMSEIYDHFFHINIDFNVGSWKLSHSLHHWINDGLMAIFFFMVGLEIKREVLIGELSDIKAAILPVLCAVGGMILPALIYLGFNYGETGAGGWGVPMATDIAFAISALVLLGKRVPPALVTFLVALAIVDDLGAVIVIAVFYTKTINMTALLLAGVMMFIMIAFNRFGIRKMLPYFIVGIFMWFFMLESGVHATIAGVLAAFAIPSKPKIAPVSFTNHTRNLLDEYDSYPVATDHVMHENQKAILQNIKDRIDSVSSPASNLEHILHLPVSLIIIPLFALANAAIAIDFSSISTTVIQNVSLGVIFGLFLGKILGIAGVGMLAVKLGVAKLPKDATTSQLFGVAMLGGIGFTMSIFVADLAFDGYKDLIFQAKVGILTASLLSGLLGFFWLKFASKGV